MNVGETAPRESQAESVATLAQVNRELDRRLQELNTLFDIGRALNVRFEREPILDLLLLTLLGHLAVARAAVYLVEKSGVCFAAGRGMGEPPKPEFTPEDLRELKRPVRAADVKDCIGGWLERNRFSLAVPMHIRGEPQGLLCIGRRIGGAQLEPEYDEFLLTLGNLAVAALDNARLFSERLAARRMEEELQLAHSIQERLLPRTLPSSAEFEIAASSVSSREVGGDYYDVVALEGGDLRIAVGDVAGKGVPAALLMANVQAGFRVLRDEADEARMMTRINGVIHENTELPRFITFVSARLHAGSSRVTYVNAGHNPPYLVRSDGRVETLTEGGLILGVFKNSKYTMAEVSFEPGDLLVLFSDGITEAMNAADDLYSEERLIECLLNARDRTAAEVLDIIQRDVERFAAGAPQRDDMTLLVVKRLGPPATASAPA